METAQPTNLGLESAKGSTKNKVIASIAGLLAIGGSISPSFAEATTAQEPVSMSTNTESLASAALAAKTKKNKLSCKKIKRIRDNSKRPLKKKEKKFLKNKCGIKYPGIYGSTKNTKLSGSIAYNWGPEPKDTNMEKPADETYFDFNSLVQTKFNQSGTVVDQKGVGAMNYYYVNTGSEKDASEFDQPMISKKPDNYDYGIILKYDVINNSDEIRGLNVTLKEYPNDLNTFIDTSIALHPNEPLELFISDSAGQPLSRFGYGLFTGQPDIVDNDNNPNMHVLSPDTASSLSLKGISRAVLKICVLSDNPQEHCYTRAVVTGKSSIFD